MDGFVIRCARMDGFPMPTVSNSPINNTQSGCKIWTLAKANTHRIQQDAAEREAPEREAPNGNS